MNRQQRVLLLGLLLLSAAVLGSANAPAREAGVAEWAVLTLTDDIPELDALRGAHAPRARLQ